MLFGLRLISERLGLRLSLGLKRKKAEKFFQNIMTVLTLFNRANFYLSFLNFFAVFQAGAQFFGAQFSTRHQCKGKNIKNAPRCHFIQRKNSRKSIQYTRDRDSKNETFLELETETGTLGRCSSFGEILLYSFHQFLRNSSTEFSVIHRN